MEQNNKQAINPKFFILILVFFFWGFIAASNSIFIPFCKSYFNLNQFESQLIGFAFYGAYFIGSLILYLFSDFRKVDILNKIGYKKGIIYGLIISILGALLMIPAVSSETKVPIASTYDKLIKLSGDQKISTADKTLNISRTTSEDFSLTVKNTPEGQKFLTNPAILANLEEGKFDYLKKNTGEIDQSKFTAVFSKEKLTSVLSALKGEEVAFGNFYFILAALFIVALGFSLQQTAAQPFAIALGSPETGSHRLNMAGGINSFGTLWGPIIVSLFLFGKVGGGAEDANVSSIKSLYLIVAAVFAAVALIFTFSKMPSVTSDAKFEKAKKASGILVLMTAVIVVVFGIIFAGLVSDTTKFVLLLFCTFAIIGLLFYSNNVAERKPDGWGAMKYPQLIWGMVAIFVYVGVEVTIDNNLGALLKLPKYLTDTGLDESQISHYISLYWGSLMIGRWTGAISIFNFSKPAKIILTVVVPFIAFGVILLANLVNGSDVNDLLIYSVCIAVLVFGFLMSNEKPVKTLIIVSTLATIAMLIGVFTTGYISLFALLSGGLFCSVMWPCIFSLSVAGLGKYTSQGSAFLIMMILGGAIIPLLQGAVGDRIGIHNSYLIAAGCFAFLIFFATKVRSLLKKQGLDFDKQSQGGH